MTIVRIFCCVWLAVALVLSPAEASAAQRPHVVLFTPGEGQETENAWERSIRLIAEAAAEDPGLSVEMVYLGGGRQEGRDRIKARVQAADAPRPDYALMMNPRDYAGEMLRFLDGAGVDAFLFNTALGEEDARLLGRPGEVLPRWIGELIPNDEAAGYLLAKHLIATARARDEGPVRVLGLTGFYVSPVAAARVRGLERAVREEPDAEILQVVSARWNGEVARAKFEHLNRRYDGIDVVWAANDDMALGVLASDAVRPDLVVGGMDWTAPARMAIAEGRLTASAGGHAFDVAYALAAIAAHAGADGDWTPPVARSTLGLLTAEDLASRAALFDEERLRALDFARLLPAGRTLGQGGTISADAILAIQDQRANGPADGETP